MVHLRLTLLERQNILKNFQKKVDPEHKIIVVQQLSSLSCSGLLKDYLAYDLGSILIQWRKGSLYSFIIICLPSRLVARPAANQIQRVDHRLNYIEIS